MPRNQTTQSNKSAKKIKQTVSTRTRSKSASINNVEKKSTETSAVEVSEETPYERVLNKVREKRRREGRSPPELNSASTKKQKPANSNVEQGAGRITANFIEDDNYVTMDVTNESMRKEFPNEEEDGDLLLDASQGESINNNAMVEGRTNSKGSGAERSPSTSRDKVGTETLPSCSSSGPERVSSSNQEQSHLKKTLGVVQKFMVSKGLIDSSLSEEEMLVLMEETNTEQETQPEVRPPAVVLPQEPQQYVRSSIGRDPLPAKSNQSSKGKTDWTLGNKNQDSSSEITIYRRAVKQINPELDSQIDNLLRQTWIDGRANNSSSSEELMDTSDEGINNAELNLSQILHAPLISGTVSQAEMQADQIKTPKELAKEQSTKLVVKAEQQKGTMYEVPGKAYDVNLAPGVMALR